MASPDRTTVVVTPETGRPGQWPARVRPATWAAVGYAAVYTISQLAFAAKTGFHVAVNDNLGLILMASHVDWSDPASLHNGFFPFALPAVLAALPSGSALPVVGIASAAFGALTLLSVYSVAARLAGAWWGVVAAVLLSLHPLFFTYFASPGPDVIATGLAAAALALYAREADRLSARPRLAILFASGLVFGVSGLFRYHTVLLAVGLLAWCLLRPERRWASVGAAFLGVLAGFLPQVVVNLLGGFGPLASDSGFTMYQSVVDIDWHATASIDPAAYASPIGIITTYPLEFAASYLETFGWFVLPLAVVALAVLIQRPRRSPGVLFSMLVSTVVFTAVVSTGNSPRGLLPVLPLAAVGVAVVARRALDGTRRFGPVGHRVAAILCILLVVVAVPYAKDSAIAAQGKRYAEKVRVATEAGIVATNTVDNASQILTNDFDFYVTGIPGTNPDTIGGWFDVSLNGRVPHSSVDLTSLIGFYCDATARGIRMVLWSPGTLPGLNPELEAAFNGTANAPLLEPMGTINGYVATRIKPDAYHCP